MSKRDLVLGEIQKVRRYTADLIDNVQDAEWFRQPADGVTHVAWQVGHLAVCQYALCLRRIRGEHETDAELLPADYFSLFGKGSEPSPEADIYPSPAEIRTVFDPVFRATESELAELSESGLDEETTPAHPMFTTKLGALQWAAQHEMLHAGQIGLIRRQLGSTPLR